MMYNRKDREDSWKEAYLSEGSRLQSEQGGGGSEQEQLVTEHPHFGHCIKISDELMCQESSGASKYNSDPWGFTSLEWLQKVSRETPCFSLS